MTGRWEKVLLAEGLRLTKAHSKEGTVPFRKLQWPRPQSGVSGFLSIGVKARSPQQFLL